MDANVLNIKERQSKTWKCTPINRWKFVTFAKSQSLCHLSITHLNPFLLTAPTFSVNKIALLPATTGPTAARPPVPAAWNCRGSWPRPSHYPEVPHCHRYIGAPILGYIFPPSGPSTHSGGLLTETPFWPQKLGNKWQSFIKFLHRASRRIFWAKREPLGSKRHSPMLMLSSGNFPCSFSSRKFLK